MKKLSYITDANSLVAIPTTSDYVDAHVLAANVAETFTKPAGARFVRLAGNATFYYNPVGTAVVPAADVINGTASIVVALPNQALVSVEDLTGISVVATAATVVTAEWFA